MGITPIYGGFEKSLYDCHPLQFHGHNFTAVRTSNQGSLVNMSSKLLTLAVTWRLFGPAGEERSKTAYLGSYMECSQSRENFANQQDFHIEQFQGHFENCNKSFAYFSASKILIKHSNHIRKLTPAQSYLTQS